MGTQTDKAIQIARRFVRAVQRSGIELDAAYLYGSHASGASHESSDIDVALVSKALTGGTEDFTKIRAALPEYDSRIETVRYHPRDFRDEDPLVWEIKHQGIPLLLKNKNGKTSAARAKHAHNRRLNFKAIVNYWLKAAREDWRWASDIFKGQHRREAYALVFGRHYLEKMLKAVIVKQSRTHAPVRLPMNELADITGITFTASERELLLRVNDYTIDNMDDPENDALRAKVTRKFCKQELDAIRQVGKVLQAHVK